MPFQKGQSGNPSGRPKVEGEIRALAQKFSRKAIQKLAKLIDSDDGRVSIAACTALLDRGFGKPAQAITGPDGGPVQVQDVPWVKGRALARS